MALFNETVVRNRARAMIRSRGGRETAQNVVAQESLQFSLNTDYDIFLSHSVRDAELVLGVKGMLDDLGYKAYIDWVDDRELDRNSITPATAERLRQRMKSSKSLFCITTDNAEASKWIPWECGYFDGLKEKVAILPVKKLASTNNTFSGVEYMGLYPYVVQDRSIFQKDMLWVHKNPTEYTSYDTWVATPSHNVLPGT